MADVDEKVVQLTLDNKSFTKDTDQTIKSLDKLKESLKFEGIGKGFDNITTAASKVDVSPVAKGVEQISMKFNALATIADAALRNITTKALDSGERLIKSLSVDQITSGWSKFEDKTKSVATLLAQGFSLQDVNAELDKLNWFTDETSYNFTDMVANISKFTASGKGLKESNVAMQGIALWTALSGQNAQTASRAMYQLSQALGAGTMRLEDYRSIQNASMDTDEFRQKALDAAVALGTLEKVGEDTYRSLVGGGDAFSKAQFASSLTEGAWFTSDVMMQVFKTYSSAVDEIYAYAQEKGITASEAMEELEGVVDEFGIKALKAGQEARSLGDALDSVKDAVSTGWMKTFELIIGDSTEATELFTDMANALYDVFAEGGNARNEILQQWKDLGGRDLFIDSLYKLAENLYEIVQTIKDAFHDIFPPMTLDTVVNLTNNFARFAANLKLSNSALSNIRASISGVLSVARGGILVLKTIFKALSPIFQLLNIGSGLILEFTGNIGRLLKSGIDKLISTRNLENLYNVVNGIAKVVAKLATGGLAAVVTLVSQIFNVVNDIWNRFENEGGGITGFITILVDELKGLWDSFVYGDTLVNKIVDGVLFGVGAIAAAIGGLIDIVMGLIRGDDLDLSAKFGDLGLWAETIMQDINASGVSGIFDKITQSLAGFISTLSTFISDLFTAESDIRTIIKNLAGDFKWLYELVKDWLMDLSTQDIQGFIVIFMLWQLVDSMKQVNVAIKGSFTALSGTFKAATTVIKEFSDPKANFVEQLNGIFNKTKILQVGAAAILLVQSLRILTEMDQQKLVNAVLILGAVAGIMVAVMKRFQQMVEAAPKGDDQKEGLGFATQFLALSAGVFLIAQAAAKIDEAIGGANWTTLIPALGYLTIFMAELGAVAVGVDRLSKGSANMFGAAAAIVAMAAAVNLVIGAIMKFDGKSLDEIGAGIVAVATTLVALGGAAALLGKANWSSLLAGTAAITALSGAIFTITVALGAISMIKEADAAIIQFAEVVLVLIGAIAALAGITKLVKPAELLSAALALDMLAVAMIALSASVAILSTVNMDAIANSLWVLAGAIIGLSTLAVANAATGGGMLAVAAAIAAIGVAALGIGAGLLLAANAAIKFVEAGALFVGFILGLGALLDKMGDDWPRMVDNAFKAIYDIFSKFLQTLILLSPQITVAAASLITSIALGIGMSTGAITAAVLGVAMGLIDAIVALVDPLGHAITVLIEGLAKHVGDWLNALGKLVEQLFSGLGILLARAANGLLKAAASWIDPFLNLFGISLADATYEIDLYLEEESKKLNAAFVEMGEQAGPGFEKGATSQSSLSAAQDGAAAVGDAAVDSAAKTLGYNSPLATFEEMGEQAGPGLQNGMTSESSIAAAEKGSEDLANAGITKATEVIKGGSYKITQAVEQTTTDGLTNVDISQFEGYLKMPGLFDFSESYKQLYQLERRAGELGAEAAGRAQGKSSWEDRKFKIEPEEQKEIDDAYEESGEEAGNYFDQGVGGGIKKSGAGTAAAKTQAEKIKDAFQESFDNMQLDEDIDDLLYKLWGAQNPNANEAQKTAMEIEYNNRKLNYAQGELKNYQQIYEQTVAAYGENSAEAVSALKQFMQAQIDVLDLQNKIAELQNNIVTDGGNNAKAFMKFSEAVGESYAYLKSEGFSNEEIRNALANETGWKQPLTQAAQNLANEGKAAATSSANAVSANFFDAMLNNVSYNIPRLSEQGKAATEAIGKGMSDNASIISNASNQLAQQTINSTKPSWLEVGKQMDVGMEQGINENADKPATASKQATQGTIDEAKSAAGVHSPSTEFIYIGEMLMEGLRVGIMNKVEEIAAAAAAAVRRAIAAARAAAGIHSPSTEGIYIGEMFDKGIVSGLDNYGYKIRIGAAKVVESFEEEAEDISKTIDDLAKEYVSKKMGEDSKIDFVLDLDTTNFDNKLAEYNKALPGYQKQMAIISEANKKEYDKLMKIFGYNGHWLEGGAFVRDEFIKKSQSAMTYASSAMSDLRRELDIEKEILKADVISKLLEKKYDPSGVTVNYTQNNTSPQALSRVDIYRDTKKLLSSFKSSLDKNVKRR